MKYSAYIHQTDNRTFFLARLLQKAEFSRPTHVYAPNIIVDSASLADVPDGANVVLGRYSDEAEAIAKSREITFFDMTKNEKFQAVNSRLTAEGTLMLIMQRSNKSIDDINALILGFGRTGAALASILSKLDVSFDIATTNSLRPAYAFANNVVPMRDFDFTPYDVIVNTVPQPVVSDAQLMSMAKDALYIDLASKPAINLEYARYLGVDADVYPALPAKVCPYSAAKAMQEFISEVIK